MFGLSSSTAEYLIQHLLSPPLAPIGCQHECVSANPAVGQETQLGGWRVDKRFLLWSAGVFAWGERDRSARSCVFSASRKPARGLREASETGYCRMPRPGLLIPQRPSSGWGVAQAIIRASTGKEKRRYGHLRTSTCPKTHASLLRHLGLRIRPAARRPPPLVKETGRDLSTPS